MQTTIRTLATGALIALSAVQALAQSQGDWTGSLGIANVAPKSGNGTLAGGEADVGSDASVTFTLEYFIRDNLGLELLAATPFEHDVSIAGIGAAGSTKHLPPTLSLNYHFPTGGAWKPYVGAGINYTTFFDEESPLGTLQLDNSWGISVQAGIDYQMTENDALRVNVRWFDIDTDVSLNGTAIGTAEIDPWLVGVAYVRRF